MKNKYLFLLGLLAMISSSCSHVYSPALFHQDIVYQPKPTSFDAKKSATYVSLGLNNNTNYNYDDVIISGQFNLSQGYAFDNFNLAYGAFGSLGDYQSGSTDKESSTYFSDRFFVALGGRISGNFYVHNDRADIRFIGFEAAYSHEFGEYSGYRNDISKLSGTHVDTRTDLFTVGLTTEVIFHNKSNTDVQHGIRGFLGTTFGPSPIYDVDGNDNATTTDKMYRHIFPMVSYFANYKQYFGTVETGFNGVFLRLGVKF